MSTSRSGAADGSSNGVCLSVPRVPENAAQEGRPEVGLPLLDLAVLRQLEEELGDSGVARSFARDYISIWDKRLQYLMRSVADLDPDAAMDAVLSLKNSTFMVGGSRLAGLAVELEGMIRNGDLPSPQAQAPAQVAFIAEVGQATIHALQQCYLSRDE
ncbi:HPt (histidine-containing phosphotransfer) domain-containing protein [Arthrobacter sp. V4I6]|uniref:Hpt domain-containing protein n=1 Tax=unclassified Arthrobacter TaxID=235627 RepID=UPI00278BA0D1|nr:MULTISPECIES: Hpt domain-containing protein [unclassified Arthrobacter]MDQ0819989.1 HPt (histidine-containing phosphotransfer) domain-containing protein [Arthrobacter sp. V1I7]MDQ0854171.1 HPt (histidine-containing phosphotransfer) domain-containing protein [Arthrobacter sp. V4I6]